MRRHTSFILISCVLIGFSVAKAEPITSKSEKLNLNQVIAKSLSNDPELQSAKATLEAGSEAKWQGAAGLLPTISASYQKNPNAKTESTTASSTTNTPWTTSRYSSASTSVQIRQPLFRPRQVLGFIQGLDQSTQAEWRYKTALNQAVIRSISTYGDWLIDEQTLRYQEKNKLAAELKELQVTKMQQAGLASLPDAAQAKADKHKASMEFALAKQQFEFSKQNFFNVIGQRDIIPAYLTGTPDPKTLEFNEHFDDLLSKVLINNFEIKAAEKAVEIASLEVKKNISDHAPTVDLVATYTDSDSFNDIALGRRTKTTAAGVLVTVPIFQGGAVLSATRQASANFRKAEADLLVTQNRVRSDFYKFYEALKSAKERWELANASLIASRLTLTSISKQEKAGLKNKIDVATAERNMAQAERDAAQAKTEWLLSKANILALIGSLEHILGNELAELFSKNF